MPQIADLPRKCIEQNVPYSLLMPVLAEIRAEILVLLKQMIKFSLTSVEPCFGQSLLKRGWIFIVLKIGIKFQFNSSVVFYVK